MTIKDLAAKTGYSLGTVSRVLNGQPNVSEKARRAILEAAASSNFQLNTTAQHLRRQRSNTIMVIVKGASNELFGALVEAMQPLAAQAEFPLMVEYIDEEQNEVACAVRLCREKKPMGILFLGGSAENFRQHFGKIDLPAVLVTGDASDLEFENLSSVSADDRLAARRAMDYLIGLGHRKIAVIGGDPNTADITLLRQQGCADAMQAAGLAFDPELDYEAVRYSYAGGYEAALALMDRGREFTAIFAMSDVMAIGAMRALQDRGRRIPEDVAIMGFDGLTIGGYTVPRLSTVAQPVQELAQQSMKILLDQIHGAPARRIILPTRIEPRESTK